MKIQLTASQTTAGDSCSHLIAQHSLCTQLMMYKLMIVISLMLLGIINRLIQVIMTQVCLMLLPITVNIPTCVLDSSPAQICTC